MLSHRSVSLDSVVSQSLLSPYVLPNDNESILQVYVPERANDVGVESKERWLYLLALATAMVLELTTWFSTSAILPQLQSVYAINNRQGQLFTIMVQIGFSVGATLSAIFTLSDIISERHSIAVGGVAAAIFNGVLCIDSLVGYYSALVLRFLSGAAMVLVYPPALKLISTWFRRERGLAMGTMVGAISLGSAMPHFITAFGGANWRVVIVTTSSFTLIGSIIASLCGQQGPYPLKRRKNFDFGQVFTIFRSKRLMLAFLGYFGHQWEVYAMWSWIAAFFKATLREREWSNTEIQRDGSLLAFFSIAVGLISSIIAGKISDSWGRTHTVIASLIISGTCSLFIGLIAEYSLEAAIIVGIIWGAAVVADSAQYSALVSELANQSYMGTALTLQIAIGYIITTGSIFLVGEIERSAGWRWTFAMLTPGPVIGVAAIIALHLDLRKEALSQEIQV